MNRLSFAVNFTRLQLDDYVPIWTWRIFRQAAVHDVRVVSTNFPIFLVIAVATVKMVLDVTTEAIRLITRNIYLR